MSSYSIVRELEKILEVLDGKSSLLDSIQAAANHYEQIVTDASLVVGASSQSQARTLGEQAKKLVLTAKKLLGSWRPGSIYRSLHALERELDAAMADAPGKSTAAIEELSESLNALGKQYESFLDTKSLAATMQVVFAAKKVSDDVTLLRKLSEGVLDHLERPVEVPAGYAELEIVLESNLSYEEIVSKLVALRDLYEALRELADESSRDYPLISKRLEASDLWVVLAGNAAVIGVVAILILDGARWIYRNYTREGKVSAIPRSVDAMDSVLQLRQKFKDAGIETDQVDEQLGKGAVTIARNLNDLLEGEPSIRVNGQLESVSEEHRTRFLRGSERSRLGPGSAGEVEEGEEK